MKFILSGHKYAAKKGWSIYLPRSFYPKRVGVVFYEKTGVLHIFEDENGCMVGLTQSRKRVQFATEKWLPTLGGDKIEKIEVEWKNGECFAQIRPPVTKVYVQKHHYGEDVARPVVLPSIDIKDALRVCNGYVAENNDTEFEIVDGLLRIKRTVVEYL